MHRIRRSFCPHPVRPRRGALAQALSVALGMGSLGIAPEAEAATITVNTASDETVTNGKCSLREAIGNTNDHAQTHADCAAGSGADTIAFDPAVFPPGALTATSVSGSAIAVSDASAATVIDGGNVVAIDGGGTIGLFSVSAGAHVTFKRLTLRNGAGSSGGAIANLGGDVTLQESTLSGNHAVHGGAVYSGTYPGDAGEGVGSLTVTGCTFSDNTTNVGSGRGGAVYLKGGTLTMTNSTVTGGLAAAGAGTFVRNGTVQLTNDTFVNDAFSGGSIYARPLAGFARFYVRNSILTGENGQGGNCYFKPSTPITMYDLGGNIDSGSSCALGTANYSVSNIDPTLAPLADNGGPTQTLRPLPGSVAIDRIGCADAPATDQRGVSRPQGAQCDVGAVEAQRLGATITVTTAQDETADDGKCSLREAIANADNNTQSYIDCAPGDGPDLIVFDPAVFPAGTLTAATLTGSVLSLSDAHSYDRIDGGGMVAIDGGGVKPLFESQIYSDTLLKGLVLRNGASSSGGAVTNKGAMRIQQCTITANVAGNGGGIYNRGSLMVIDSTLSGNSAPDPTGHGGAINSAGFGLVLVNSTISGNSASNGGAMFLHQEYAYLTQVTMAGNSATFGGGIFVAPSDSYGTLDMKNSIFSGSTGGNCDFTSAPNFIHDKGGNIDDASSCGFSAAAGSFSYTNPKLGPLAINGGPTRTLMPQMGSPAVDAIDCLIDVDQRGVMRPQGAKCDIGAVESDTVFSDGFEGGPAGCQTAAQCPAGTDPQCTSPVCTSGVCSVVNATMGTVCGPAGMGTCDGMGSCH